MDTEYIIDSAIEFGQLTPIEVQAVEDFPEVYREIRALVDSNLRTPDHFLENISRRAFDNASPEIQMVVAIRAIRGADLIMQLVKGRVTHSIKTIMDRDTGEGILSFMELMGLDNTSAVNPEDGSNILIDTPEKLTESNVIATINHHHGWLIDRLKEDYSHIVRAVAWYRQDGGSRFRDLENILVSKANWDYGTINPREVARTLNPNIARTTSKQKSKVIGAVKKVTKLFHKFGWEDNLRMVVSGREITLQNESSNLKFIVTPPQQSGWLEKRTLSPVGHTPFDLAVYTKKGDFVARLCVYFEATPVLDQLLALSLFIKSGDEEDILLKANWFGTNPAVELDVVSQHPSLAIKFQKNDLGELKSNVISAFLQSKNEVIWEEAKGRVEAWVNTHFLPVFGSVALTDIASPISVASTISANT